MKLIIDVPNYIYERWSNIEMPTVGEVRDVQEAMKVGTPIPDDAISKAEIVEIINEPTKHIQIVRVDGKDTICYSPKFVELLELLKETCTDEIDC